MPIVTVIAALTATTAGAITATAGTTLPRAVQATQERSPDQIETLMRRHMESSGPGPEHEPLAALAGSWDIEITMWPEPGAQPLTMRGTVEAEMILGGRFLVQHGDLSDVDPSGRMMTIVGFDRRSGEYTLIGLDTSGTYWVTASGPANDDGGGAVLSGEDYDAIFEGTQLYDFVLDWSDPETFRTQIVFKDEIHTRGGPPFKMVETVSRRRR